MAARLIWPRAGKLCCCCSVPKLYPTLGDVMDYIALQAPLSMGFSRQEYWSGLPFHSPGELPSRPRDRTWVSRIGGWILYDWATWEAQKLECCDRHSILDGCGSPWADTGCWAPWSEAWAARPCLIMWELPPPQKSHIKQSHPRPFWGRACAPECELPRLHPLIKE